MPARLRSLLFLFALLAIALACAAATVSASIRSSDVGPDMIDGFATGAVAIDRPAETSDALTRRGPKPLGERAATIALTAVGVPYRWGGASPASGFDCSGLVYWSYGRLGVALPHSSYAQYGLGRAVPRSRMQPGDLLFFSGLGHVGMYIGEGRMVHAPHSGRLVEVVALGRSSYASRIVGVRRIN
jgi:cell wall-associated NlpC family hydrolase